MLTKLWKEPPALDARVDDLPIYATIVKSRNLSVASHALRVFEMVLHNPNNWHWVTKSVTSWTRDWFQETLTKLEAKDGDVEAKISKVQSMTGDVDVSQRKGKVITIFDVKLVVEFTGRLSAS